MAYPTVTNTFASGTTCIASQWNTNFSDIISGTADGTKDFKVNNVTTSNLVFASDIYSAPLTDYSSISTITGWVSFTTKKIYYKKWDKIVFVYYYLAGTSNSSLVRFTVPYSPLNYLTYIIPVYNQPTGAGVPNPFCGNLSFYDASTVNISMALSDANGVENASWYASDVKLASGQFFYQTT